MYEGKKNPFLKDTRATTQEYAPQSPPPFAGLLFGLRVLFTLSYAPIFSIIVVLITKSNIHIFFMLNRDNLAAAAHTSSLLSVLLRCKFIGFYSPLNTFTDVYLILLAVIFLSIYFLLSIPLNKITLFWLDFLDNEEHPQLRHVLNKVYR